MSEQYRYAKKGDAACISLERTVTINSDAIPLLCCVLNTMYKFHNHPIYLEINYNRRLQLFLNKINFYHTMSSLGFIQYDEDQLGGFSDLKERKNDKNDDRDKDEKKLDYNDKHKIQCFDPFLEYNSLKSEEKEQIRDVLAEQIKYGVVSDYINILSDKISGDEDILFIKTMITEIVLNSQLYSGSKCYIYLQSGIKIMEQRTRLLLSVADIGKGFMKSLDDKIREGTYSLEDRNIFYDLAERLRINKSSCKDFLAIMEALYFSQQQTREMNLYRLKNLLANRGATFKIHNNCTQVKFTYKRCKKCTDRNILHCMECIWTTSRTVASDYSPVQWNMRPLAGVHIDIQIEFDAKKQMNRGNRDV